MRIQFLRLYAHSCKMAEKINRDLINDHQTLCVKESP